METEWESVAEWLKCLTIAPELEVCLSFCWGGGGRGK